MLEFCKTVVNAVSFDRLLFEKEIRKSLDLLSSNELHEFKNWCYQNFGESLIEILNKCF